MPVGAAVFVPAVAVGLDVLNEGAAEGDVQELVAAADAEDGQIAVQRLVRAAAARVRRASG